MAAEDCRVDSTLSKVPTLKNGIWTKNQKVLKDLGYQSNSVDKDAFWVQMKSDSVGYQAEPLTLIDNLVPNVYGMGARDALYLLEKLGLRVNVSGSGRVVSQSIGPGQKIVKGRTVNLVMR